MKKLSKTIFFCLLGVTTFAQKNNAPTVEEMQREMLEMQRRLLQQFQQMAPNNPSFSMPEWNMDTTFSFRIDTLFGGEGMGRSFFFSPFGQDTTFLRDFDFHNPFLDGKNPFGDGFMPRLGFPENEENSALGDPGDGLLPEERLRKEQDAGETTHEKQSAPAQKPSKIKTIRI